MHVNKTTTTRRPLGPLLAGSPPARGVVTTAPLDRLSPQAYVAGLPLLVVRPLLLRVTLVFGYVLFDAAAAVAATRACWRIEKLLLLR